MAERSVSLPEPHFGLGHFCAGCENAMKLHRRCVVSNSSDEKKSGESTPKPLTLKSGQEEQGGK